MKKTGLIGEKLGHSLSPQIHARFYHITNMPGSYALFETPKSGIGALLSRLESEGYTGLNVTIPYKAKVMQYLDDISAEAAGIGAVNTIHFKDGKRIGYNTDYFGLKILVASNGIAVKGRRVVILGTGGAAKCAHRLMCDMGAKEVCVISRRPRADKTPGAVGYDALDALGAIDVLINATPVGMSPDTDGCPVSDGVIKRCVSVIDIVYNPPETVLIKKARACGKTAVNGLLMLGAQAVRAQEIWNSQTYGKAVYDDIYSLLVNIVAPQKTNIVLIGMPGSGKTTVGMALAERLHMAFADTDEMIEQKHGRIPDIFANQGEAAFRQYEYEAAKEAAALRHTVISTGGGIILNEHNMHALGLTGTVVFLDRPLESLVHDTDTATRPLLADGKDALIALFEKRYPLYQRYAEIVPDNTADVDTCVTDIIKKLEEHRT
ncbi:MAG: shikimate kinase [Eubacteriales bacterium]|nr:shikimate kinase [Eubacteriales bacterium]